MNIGIGTKAGTIGGTLLSVIVNVPTEDVMRTALLAAFGAVISFTVSLLLKMCVQRISKYQRSRR